MSRHEKKSRNFRPVWSDTRLTIKCLWAIAYLNKFLSNLLTNLTQSLKIFWFDWINSSWWKCLSMSLSEITQVPVIATWKDLCQHGITVMRQKLVPALMCFQWSWNKSHPWHIMKLCSGLVIPLRKRSGHQNYLLLSFRKAIGRIMATSSDQNFHFATLHEVILTEQSVKCKNRDEHA